MELLHNAYPSLPLGLCLSPLLNVVVETGGPSLDVLSSISALKIWRVTLHLSLLHSKSVRSRRCPRKLAPSQLIRSILCYSCMPNRRRCPIACRFASQIICWPRLVNQDYEFVSNHASYSYVVVNIDDANEDSVKERMRLARSEDQNVPVQSASVHIRNKDVWHHPKRILIFSYFSPSRKKGEPFPSRNLCRYCRRCSLFIGHCVVMSVLCGCQCDWRGSLQDHIASMMFRAVRKEGCGSVNWRMLANVIQML